MKTELDRNFSVLKNQPVPVYYMCYHVQDVRKRSFVSRFGLLYENKRSHDCKSKVTVRAGSHEKDYLHRAAAIDGFEGIRNASVDSPFALKKILWESTEKLYRYEAKRYERAKAQTDVNVEASDKSADFSREMPEQYYEAPLCFDELIADEKKWEEKIKLYSQVFNGNKDLVNGSASLNIELFRKYFVDTDGAVIVQNSYAYRLSLMVQAIAEDGMELPLYKSYYALKQKDLPSDSVIMEDARQLSMMATRLKNAPVAESYSGPAMLSPLCSSIFFHEIFGHRIEGSGLKHDTDAQTFKKKPGETVLPEDISVIFDPQLTEFNGQPLSGGYVYDDEGVRGQQVTVIDNGVLKSFLMSRTPIEGFPKSNGHGRSEINVSGLLSRNPEARQSNMIVRSSHPYSEHELREMLIDGVRQAGKEYGYLFDGVFGGFTNTGRIIPNTFNITPTVVYRVYTDGRPDELVRGINLIGTPLSVFSQISACGDDYDVFNGFCGAPSGSLPVSCVAPSLFVKMIETQKKQQSISKPPILERPHQ